MTPNSVTDETQRHPDVATIVWVALVAVGVPAVFLPLARNLGGKPEDLQLQNACLVAATLLLVAALAARLGPARWRPRSRTLPLLTAGGSALIVLSILWNKAFIAYHWAGGVGHIMRRVFVNFRSPFYVAPHDPEVVWAVVAIAWCALLLLYLWRRPLADFSNRALAAQLAIFQLGLLLWVSLAAGSENVGRFVTDYDNFLGYTEPFDGALDLLRRYVSVMPELDGFARHYPPGIPFVFELAGSFGVVPIARLGFSVLPALTVFPLMALGRELGLEARASKLAAVLFVTSATLAIFPSSSPTPSLAFFATVAFWLLVRSLERDELGPPAAMGFVVALFTFCSFAIYLVVLPMGVYVLAGCALRRFSVARAVAVIGTSLAVFLVFFLVLDLATGFNLAACLENSIKFTIVGMFRTTTEFVLRCTGSLLAYAVSAGFPLTVLAVAAVRDARSATAPRLVFAFAIAVCAGVLLGAASGRSYLETERIWLFYTPLLAIAAGYALNERQRREGDATLYGALAAALTFTITYTLFLRHHL